MGNVQLGHVLDENHVIDAGELDVVRRPVRTAADGLEGEASCAAPCYLQRHLQHMPIHQQVQRAMPRGKGNFQGFKGGVQ